MIPQTSSCRYCDSTGHHASRLRPFDWPLYALGFVPIRCKTCGARSYRHRIQGEKKPIQRGPAAKHDDD